MSEELINVIIQYAPTVLVVITMVLSALGQKSNLLNGLKTIAKKADEIEESAKLTNIQAEMNGLIEQEKETNRRLKELINRISKLENREEND